MIVKRVIYLIKLSSPLDPNHNLVYHHQPQCLCHARLPLLPKAVHHHPSSREEREEVDYEHGEETEPGISDASYTIE